MAKKRCSYRSYRTIMGFLKKFLILVKLVFDLAILILEMIRKFKDL